MPGEIVSVPPINTHKLRAKLRAAAEKVAPPIAAAASELVFYPLETMSKRLQVHQGRMYQPNSPFNFKAVMQNVRTVILQDAKAGFAGGVGSLFRGFPVAVGYKITQRLYKLGGQPVVSEGLHNHFGATFTKRFGKKAKLAEEATAGAVIGAGEAFFLLPADWLKIRWQTNPKSVEGKSLLAIFREMGLGLYDALGLTVVRNIFGSLAMFGTRHVVREQLPPQVDANTGKSSHTLMQNVFSSTVASIASLYASSAFDVLKARRQCGKYGDQSAFVIAVKMLKHEGFYSMFKGMSAKVPGVAPRLILGMTVFETFNEKIKNRM